ncbi:redox-regulated ATPase YchF [Candidatus Roizmanbacteria bacterium]|nr:redox-regulated ATPase YchF [Candidatus Roizmanbacteria bacterium]
MNLSIGIVGLPNVGKSTLFNALLKKSIADVANYPFCTIEPNVGIVEVPDARLPVLAKIVNTEKIVPAVVEFYDIAGLVKGASTGEGLGNKFLSHIREVAAIVHVVRIFEDSNVIHVANKIDPVNDIQVIETELILADLETLSKQREPKNTPSKADLFFYEVVKKLKTALNNGVPARNVALDADEKTAATQLHLITMKPQFFAFNVSEEMLIKSDEIKETIKKILDQCKLNRSRIESGMTTQVQDDKAHYLYLCNKLENEIVAFSPEEQTEYLQQYGLEETGLNRLIQKAYETLGLISFLTAGEKEVRAWTIEKGMLGPQAAGTIHTDFEKHYIKADIVPYATFVEVGGWIKAREQGKVQIVGKDYEMKDGDVVEFKVGV